MRRSPRPAQITLLLTALAVGCATEPGVGPDSGSASAAAASAGLELDPPERGFQVQSLGVMVEPGDEVRWCEVVRLPGGPGDVFYVDRIEAALTGGATDLVVSAAEVGSTTEEIMDVGARVPCTRAGEAFGEDLRRFMTTQAPYEERTYPDGVAKVVQGGQKLALDYRYRNQGEEPLAAVVKLNFHTVDERLVRSVAHTASFQNLTIYTPPGGRSSHLGECVFDQPVTVNNLVRRTQQHGTGFSVWVAGGERDGELLWYSPHRDDNALELDEPLTLGPGEGFRFQCDYLNDNDRELRFGVGSEDETCTLDATFWAAEDADEDGLVDPADGLEMAPQGCLLLEVDDDGIARD
ncbi:MAG: hypothetical protein PVI30_16485 [Myxococcales bacterium]|jgi:hypothetical protein